MKLYNIAIIATSIIISSCSILKKDIDQPSSNKITEQAVNDQVVEDIKQEAIKLTDIKNEKEFVKYYLRTKFSLYSSDNLSQIAQNSYKSAITDPNNALLQEQAFLLTLASRDYAKALNISSMSKNDELAFYSLFDLNYKVAQEDYSQAKVILSKLLKNQNRLPHLKILDAFFKLEDHKSLEKFETDVLAINSTISLNGFKYYYIGRAYEINGDYENAFKNYSNAFFLSALRTSDVFSRLVYTAKKLYKHTSDKPLNLSKLFESNNSYGDGLFLVDNTFININNIKPLDTSLKSTLGQIFYDLGWSVVQTSANLAGLDFLSLSDYISPSDKNKYQLAFGLSQNKWNADAKEIIKNISTESQYYISAQILLLNNVKKDNMKQSLEIIENLNKTTILDKSYIQSLKAEVLLQHNKYAQAITPLTKALSNGVTSKLLFSRAVAYERTNNYKSAIKDLKQAIELNPNNPIVLNYLGYLLVDLNIDQAKGLSLIEQSVELDPINSSSLDSLGWAHLKMKNYELGLKFLEQAYALTSSDGVITGHLGDAYYYTGRKKEAISYWKKGLQLEKKDMREILRIQKQLNKYQNYNN